MTVGPSSTTGAGDLLTLVIRGVVNPATAGLHTVILSTSADPRPVPLSYTLAPAQSVSHPFLQMSSYARSATGVTWSVGFSSPGRLTGFSDPTGDSAVTIVAPTGTRFPASTACDNAYLFVDPIDGIDHCAAAKVSGGGSKVVIEPQMATTPGAVMALVISGVTNPPGAGALQVRTTSDPVPVSIPTSRPTIPAPAVQLDGTSARGTLATYAATFRLSSAFNGANCLSNPSKLALSGPAGTVFPAAGYTFYDLANGTDAGAGACLPQGTTYTPGDMVPLAPGIAAGAVKVTPGDYFAVVATSVVNAGSAGSYHLGVSASTGTSVDPGYALTSPTKVASPVLQVLSNVAGANEVHYAITFRAVSGLLPDNSTLTLSLPGAAWGPGSGDNDGWTVSDDTTGLVGAGSASYAGKPASPNQTDNAGTAVVTPTTGNGFRAAPGDIVTIATDGTVNPSGPGSHVMTFSTSGDPAPAALRFVMRAPPALNLPMVNLSSHQAGAKDGTYALTFVSNGGLTPDWSAVSMAFAGAIWPPSVGDNDGFVMYDDTTDLDAGASGTISGKGSFQPISGTALITPGTGDGFYAASGDVVTVLAKPTVNPSGAGSHTVVFSTSADPLPTKVTARLR